jgi:hypothetical protein
MSEPAPDVNALLDEARIPFALKAAAIAMAASGLTTALVGLQNVTMATWIGGWWILPAALIGVGVVAIGVAAKLVRGRSWSLGAGLGAAALLALGSTGFFMVASMSGLFSLLALIGVGGGITALVMTVLAIGPFRRLMRTRVRLREAGYDLDL